MTDDYVEQRRRYVQEVRHSFSDDSRTKKPVAYISQQDVEQEEIETVGNAVFWKVKIILSVMLFAAFVLCDRTGMDVFHFKPQMIVDQIQKSYTTPFEKDFNKQIQNILNLKNDLISDK